MNEIGTYCKLYEVDGSAWCVDERHEPAIDAAVTHYIETGRDAVLTLDTVFGYTLRLLASRIGSWFVSTPDNRERTIAVEHASDKELTATKRSLGVFDGE